MPIYHGSDLIESLYHGGDSIRRVYHGSTLVFDTDAPFVDYFANDGASDGFIGQAAVPSALYDAIGNKTWVARGGWDGSRRTAYVQTYDHSTNRWGKRYLISTETLVDDSHGRPSIVMDGGGYVHCFFGSHASAMKYAVTTSPRDPSAWEQKASIGTDLSYPHAVVIGSTLYLFARGNTQQSLVRYKGTLSGGVATWGSETTLVTFTGGRFYPGDCFAVGTKIHIVANFGDSGDTFRRDIYHFVNDTGDDGIEDSTNSVNTATGSQPISKATADTSYIIVDQTTNVTAGYGLCRTSDGDLHLAYIDDTASPYDINYITFDGSSWSSPELVTTVSATPDFGSIATLCLIARADDSLELWFPSDPDSEFDAGGKMERVIRSSGGVWGSETTARDPDGTFGYTSPISVLDADESLYVLFGEGNGSVLDGDAGDLKFFAYGSGGFVQMGKPFFTSVPVISGPDGFFGDGDTLTVAFDHTGTSETYQWKADGVAISGATNSTYTLTASEVGSEITVTVTGTNFAGSTDSTSAGVSAVTPTFATQTRTLSDASNRTLSDSSDRTISNRTA